MKNRIIVGIVAGLLVAMGAGLAQADYTNDPVIQKREMRQEHRIRQGVANGSLTPRETRRLAREQGHIRHMEARMKSDGYLTRGERFRLHHAQNRANRHIWRMKHNGNWR